MQKYTTPPIMSSSKLYDNNLVGSIPALDRTLSFFSSVMEKVKSENPNASMSELSTYLCSKYEAMNDDEKIMYHEEKYIFQEKLLKEVKYYKNLIVGTQEEISDINYKIEYYVGEELVDAKNVLLGFQEELSYYKYKFTSLRDEYNTINQTPKIET
jgi:hypothetical protein